MPIIKKQTPHRQTEPKSFECTGYGDCHMRFNRSEHLARHTRKHTGEKPFKCVIPGCERTFSRFDNMIQHTSTHGKQDVKKEQGTKKKQQGHKTKGRSNENKPRPTHIASPPYTSLPRDTWSSISSDHLSPHPIFLPSPKQLGLHFGDSYLPSIPYLDNDNSDQGFSSSSSTASSPVSMASDMSPPPSFGRMDDWALPPPYLSTLDAIDLSMDEIQAVQGMTRLSLHHPVTFNILPQQYRWSRESNSRFTPRTL